MESLNKNNGEKIKITGYKKKNYNACFKAIYIYKSLETRKTWGSHHVL